MPLVGGQIDTLLEKNISNVERVLKISLPFDHAL